MKIYFIGSQSTGKTTLARFFSKYYNIPLLGETIRKVVAREEVSLNKIYNNIDEINRFQMLLLSEQIEIEDQHKSYISDRGFDFIIYAAEYSTITNIIYNQEVFQKYMDRFFDNNTYTFFIRPQKDLMIGDDFRHNLNWEEINRIDGMFKFFMEMNKIRYFSINMLNLQERINLIKNIIGNQCVV